MSRTTHTEVFKYSELSPEAQERARDWYRGCTASDTDNHDFTVEDFKTLATACGFDIEMSRGTRSTPAVYWSGFWSQRDGASFTASWRAERVRVAALLKDWPAVEGSPGNIAAHKVMADAAALAALDSEAYGSTSAGRGHYQVCDYGRGEDMEDIDSDAADRFKELCTDLADWLYRQLEREYEWQNADAQVAENIIANEYEFTADGNIA